jgi:hypothetical protein
VEEAKSNMLLLELMLRLEAKKRGLKQIISRLSKFYTAVYEYQSSLKCHY